MEKIIEDMKLWEKAITGKTPLCDIKNGIYKPTDEIIKGIIKYADECCTKVYPIIPVTLYKRFADDGNRSEYEKLYFERRDDLLCLAVAEFTDNEGKYINKIFDLLWSVCEETTWILPAHYCQYKKDTNIPDNYVNGEHYIDLFSAATGAALAVTYYLLKDKMIEFGGKVVSERIIYELNNRIINPFLDADDMPWMGLQGQFVNNWTPWIVSNVLTVASLIGNDIDEQKEIIKKASKCLDCFIKTYGEDGGCNEGPAYWGAAGGSFFDCLEILSDMTDEKEKVFSPYLKPIFEYIVKVHICGSYFINYGDNLPEWDFDRNYFNRIGTEYSIPELVDLDGEVSNFKYSFAGISYHPMRYIKNLYGILKESTKKTARKIFVLPDMQLCVFHENENKNTGFCAWLKGGHNAESHNHNDVGSVGLYLDGKPLLVDIGIGEYTKFTFNELRYTLFPIRSCDHNLPLIDDVGEKQGQEYKSDSFTINEDDMSACIEYKSAYENRKQINKRTRSIKMQGGKVILEDSIDLKTELDVKFNLYFCEKVDIHGKEIKIGNRARLVIDDNISAEAEKLDIIDKKLCSAWKNGIYRLKLSAGKSKQVNTKCIFERL